MTNPTSLLIVDDNSSLTSAYQPLLGEHGFRVITASTGREAVSLCEGEWHEVALAIVDLKMPGLDGPATIAALQENSPLLKVIAVSGGRLSPFFGRLADLGVRHFVPKPFCLQEILEAIEEITVVEDGLSAPEKAA